MQKYEKTSMTLYLIDSVAPELSVPKPESGLALWLR